MLLRHTESAIEDIVADLNLSYGQHLTDELASASDGIVIGETAYDTTRNTPSQIHHNSIMGAATGAYYVRQSIPERPINISIVEHRDADEASLSKQEDKILRSIWFGRQALSRLLVDVLGDSLPTTHDTVNSYIVGSPTENDRLSSDSEIITNTDDPIKAAEAVAEIAEDGLTFVIGSMRRLPLEKIEDTDYDSLVAIKTNHLYDRMLMPGTGPWRTGNPQMPEVNTDDPAQLTRWNTYLNNLHQQRVTVLQSAGIAVASAVFNPKLKPFCIDVIAFDKSLSSAIESVGKKL
jgi:hypothetical protein